MKIREVVLTATDLDLASKFYREILELPVATFREGVAVRRGRSRLVLTEGVRFGGAHHLAFSIAPHDFDIAHRWLRQRVELITVDESDVFDGPEGWDSRSMYFRGPEGIVLELISRQSDRSEPGSRDRTARLLSISEVGIGVPDVEQAVGQLVGAFGFSPFPPQLADFAPIGGHDGLIILANSDRIWFPTSGDAPARGPLTVEIETAEFGERIALEGGAIVRTRQA